MNSLSHNAAVKARSEPDILGGYENLFYGYEIARAAREDGHDVCLVAEEDEVNALEGLGFAAIAPKERKMAAGAL